MDTGVAMSSNNTQETNVSVQPKSSNVSLSSVIPSSLVPTVIVVSMGCTYDVAYELT